VSVPGPAAVPVVFDVNVLVLAEMAEASGGGSGRVLIVSADADLTGMSPWRGRPVIEPSQFASMVDASRRVRRRRR
jgi:hypothetical protein